MTEIVPFARSREGIRLAVRVTPKASANRLTGLIADGRGGYALKASVTAAPEDGKANAALIKLLARHFGLKQRELTVVAGAADRAKLVAIAGDPATLAVRLAEGLRAWSTPN
jgi:uncharacterized protein (TIGR00251 family)